MPSNLDNSQKTDLRVLKTHRALTESMFSLLEENRFSKLTVDKICKEGMLSRATFYTYFSDKYDLLEYWLFTFWSHKIIKADAYETLKKLVDLFIKKNGNVLKNLLIGADEYTYEILRNFLCSVFNMDNTKRTDDTINQKNAVVVNLYINGIVDYLLWQAKNDFPSDMPIINKYSFEAIKKLWDWAEE